MIPSNVEIKRTLRAPPATKLLKEYILRAAISCTTRIVCEINSRMPAVQRTLNKYVNKKKSAGKVDMVVLYQRSCSDRDTAAGAFGKY